MRCSNDHRHVHLVGGRAAKAAEYPPDLVDAFLDALQIETAAKVYNLLKDDGKGVGVEKLHEKEFSDWGYVDDVTGKELDKAQVARARKEELQIFQEMGVYEHVPRRVMEQSQSGKLVGVRWVDVLKDSGVRSRLVAQEFATTERDDIFAATPPLAAIKAIISKIASSGRGGAAQQKLMVLDVKRAFLYGDLAEEIYVELPDEDEKKRKGYVGRLRKAMYGTRSAPTVWQKLVRATMIELGFRPCIVAPCVYYHEEKDLLVATHVDDFICGGSDYELRWLETKLGEKFHMKAEMVGPDPGDAKSTKFLGRTIQWKSTGILWWGDPKHAEILLEEEDMEGSRPVCTPGVSSEKDLSIECGRAEEMSQEQAKRYRRSAARINYMALDRPDLAFCAKELSRAMAKPTTHDGVRLKRAIRYIKGAPTRALEYVWQDKTNEIRTYSDSDWAGCVTTRKSSSGGVIMRGKHLICHWSSTQATIALSVAEAELNAIAKAASETIGVLNMLRETGDESNGKILTASSAAKGIAHRRGAGKVKHLEARQLWVQEVVANKVLELMKVPRAENPSDALTHHWLGVEGDKHFPALGLRQADGSRDACNLRGGVGNMGYSTLCTQHTLRLRGDCGLRGIGSVGQFHIRHSSINHAMRGSSNTTI